LLDILPTLINSNDKRDDYSTHFNQPNSQLTKSYLNCFIKNNQLKSLSIKMLPSKKIIIIGGGIGGVATALALHRVGIEAIVYERTHQIREVGAGLALWANATHVLKNLDLLEDVLHEGHIITRYQFKSQHDKELMTIPVDHFDTPALCIHRANLHALLCRNLPSDRLILGETFERFEQIDNKVRTHFASGLIVEADGLIGADGLNSRVRAQLDIHKPIYRGFTTWRGLTNYIPSTYQPGYICESLGCGKAFGFVTIGNERMYWYVAAKAAQRQPEGVFGRKNQLLQMFKDWHQPILELIAATDEANILKTDLYDRVPTFPWGKENITLLGDAAHPTLPTLGQGACMALEDALVVTKYLAGNLEVIPAFQEYESQRFRRTKMIVEESLQAGQMMNWENRAAVALRETVMKLLPTAVLKNKIKPLHSYKA
jgi:2-polyprenyl-6-methoxyphenol hydroxylase-like FAD-dependent oxidoreductase